MVISQLWWWAVLGGCTPDPAPGVEADPLTAGPLHDATFALTSLGPRQVATPAEEQARAWVEATMLEIGLQDVGSEPFEMDAWRPGTASLEIGGEARFVEGLSPSPPTEVTLDLVALSDDVTGAAVVASSDEGSRAEAYLSAVTGGAAALVRITDQLDHDGEALVEVGHLLEGSTLPAVAVDQPTGDWVRAHLGEPVTVRITPDVVRGHVASNVVGRVAGRGGSASVYVVAHYDSWHPSEGAFDNALGVGALVQLAKAVVAGPTPEREVVFIATGGEEQGLQGASAWVADHADEIGPEDTVLTLDVVWAGEGTYYATATNPAWTTALLDAAAVEGLEMEDGGTPSFSSDHVPFVTRGAGAVWAERWPDRHYHTVADTLDNLDLDEAAAALRVNWAILQELAGIGSPP